MEQGCPCRGNERPGPGYEHATPGDVFRISNGAGCRDNTKRIQTNWVNSKLGISLLPREQKRGALENHDFTPIPPIFPVPLPTSLMVQGEKDKQNQNGRKKNDWGGTKIPMEIGKEVGGGQQRRTMIPKEEVVMGLENQQLERGRE